MRELKGRYPYLVAVHAFVYNTHGEVLLLKRSNTGYMDGWWGVPAGHVEAGESVIEAMARELKEEVGLLLPSEVSPTHVMHRPKPGDERVDYFFALPEWSGTVANCEPEKCSEILWKHPNALPHNTIHYIAHAHTQVAQSNPFSIFYDEM